jgi:hypothetical protein
MHAATASIRLAFEIVARVEMRALGDITECHEESDLSCIIRSVMTMAMKHAQLNTTLPSSHHHQSLRPSIQDPSFLFSRDEAKKAVFDSERSKF